MPDRTPEQILKDWRAAEAQTSCGRDDPLLAERINTDRAEYAKAVADRDVEAQQLAQAPSASVGEVWWFGPDSAPIQTILDRAARLTESEGRALWTAHRRPAPLGWCLTAGSLAD